MSENNYKYSLEIKLEAVKMYLDSGVGSHTVAKMVGISCNKRVLDWAKKYQQYGIDGLLERRGCKRKDEYNEVKSTQLNIEEENLKLKAEVAYLKKLLQIERK